MHTRCQLCGRRRAQGAKLFYEAGPAPSRDIDFEYPLPGSPSFHRRIRYELFGWLRERGEIVSLEIPISEEGRIYGPDEITISETDGIVSWFTHRWGSHAVDRRPPYVKVDVISEKDGIRGYEVKALKDLRREGPELMQRTIGELVGMARSAVQRGFPLPSFTGSR